MPPPLVAPGPTGHWLASLRRASQPETTAAAASPELLLYLPARDSERRMGVRLSTVKARRLKSGTYGKPQLNA